VLTEGKFFVKLGTANQPTQKFTMNNPQLKLLKVYVTEYALTAGVYLTEAEISECGRFARAKNQFGADTAYTLGKSAFFTVEEAKANFEKRKASAIKSAEKKIKKLETLEFSFTDCID
jgi:hypothetical protein